MNTRKCLRIVLLTAICLLVNIQVSYACLPWPDINIWQYHGHQDANGVYEFDAGVGETVSITAYLDNWYVGAGPIWD